MPPPSNPLRAAFCRAPDRASTRAEASLKESAEERAKGGRLSAPRVTGMYSKHRQKNAQILPTQCGRFLFLLSFLLLHGGPERASGDPGEQGTEKRHAHASGKVVFLLLSTSCAERLLRVVVAFFFFK